MKERRNNKKSCLAGHDSASFSPLLFCALFLFFTFGPLGPLAAICAYFFVGRLIVGILKLAERSDLLVVLAPVWRKIPQMPMWGVGLALTTLLAFAGYLWAWFAPSNIEKVTSKNTGATVRSKIIQSHPLTIEAIHSGLSKNCEHCADLLFDHDPDIIQWKQSKAAHIVTLTIFEYDQPLKDIRDQLKKVRFQRFGPAPLLRDDRQSFPSIPGIDHS